MKKILKLSESKDGHEYIYLNCIDVKYFKILLSYGFIKNMTISVLSKNRGGVVVSVLGSRYMINNLLASVIEVEEKQ